MNQIFLYTLTFIESRLGLLIVSFCNFETELRPLIDVGISFPFHILRVKGQNLIKLL